MATTWKTLENRMNSDQHEVWLRVYVFVVLAHWGEHLVQAFQIFVLKWARPDSRGILGHFFPWLSTSESLHYFYALFMLVGLWVLRKGFIGRSLKWWLISLAIQFWHHFEHFLLQMQVLIGRNLFDSPVPTSLVQYFVPKVELHMFYNTVVFIPMVVAMYYHLLPTDQERAHAKCTCALKV